jgi:hypothetical protein
MAQQDDVDAAEPLVGKRAMDGVGGGRHHGEFVRARRRVLTDDNGCG